MGKRKRLEKGGAEKTVESKTSPLKAAFGFGVVLLITYLAYHLTMSSPDVAPGKEVKGSYTLFNGLESTHEPGKVKMVLFFDFYCTHCYEFDSDLVPELKREYEDKLEIELVAYPLREESLVPIHAYESAKGYSASTGERMREELFNAFYVDGRNIGDRETECRRHEEVHRFGGDRLHGGHDLLAGFDSRRVEAVGAGVRECLEPADGLVEVGPAADKALGARGEDHITARFVDCGAGSADAREREIEVIERL